MIANSLPSTLFCVSCESRQSVRIGACMHHNQIHLLSNGNLHSYCSTLLWQLAHLLFCAITGLPPQLL